MKISKQQKQQKKTKTMVISSIIILILLLVSLSVYIIGFKGSFFGWQPFSNTSQPSPINPADTSTKPETTDENKGDSNTVNKTTDEVPVSEDLAINFTNLSQSGGFVIFSGSTNDTKNIGTCSILFTNPEDKPVTRSSAAIKNNGKAECGPIKIPETEFSLLGDWKATYRYYVNDAQAVVERTIKIQ